MNTGTTRENQTIGAKAEAYVTERTQAIRTLRVLAHRFGAELVAQADYKGFADEANAAMVTAYVQAQTALLDLLKEDMGW
ncbi:MAG: hypothetical protein IKS31_00055 [Clostridia bacterium]|nr:hypothetical protein [Clostridia bacterium]